MIYITGDCHGEFGKIHRFCMEMGTTREDIMIILGDAGINMSNGLRDLRKKQMLSQIPVTLFCIHGNHEMRPTRVMQVDEWGGRINRKAYSLKDWHGGRVYVESAFPSILFARDGEVYDLDGTETLVIGGAYSPDKPMRLARGWPWFPDEQPDVRIRKRVEKAIEERRGKVDALLTHTIPARYIPYLHLRSWPGVDQSTEHWLDLVEDSLQYKKWYAGHFHVDVTIGKLEIMMNHVEPFMGGNRQRLEEL
jgi:hypothetical protein